MQWKSTYIIQFLHYFYGSHFPRWKTRPIQVIDMDTWPVTWPKIELIDWS